jgi:hypothetical protein
MKNFLKFSFAATLVALALHILLGWPFWTVLIVLEICYGIYLLDKRSQRLATVAGVILVLSIAGGWAWSQFKAYLPLSNNTLPYGTNFRDAQIARAIDPGLSRAQSALLLELRKKEDALADSIPALMRAGKYDEMKQKTQELIDLRKDIEKLLKQAAPPPPPPPPQTTAPISRSTASLFGFSGKVLEIELSPDQVYNVDDLRQGQNWRYLSFSGAFSHRIDHGDDSACWKLVENNLPWSADYDGKLQIKAGNTTVKLTVNVL